MRKFFKITLYIIGGVLLLVLLAVGFLVSPYGKRFVRDKAVAFLNKKLKTEVRIGEIVYSLPKMVGVKNVFVRDLQQDTLLSVGLLKVDIDLLKLLQNKVSVNDLIVEDLVGNVNRRKPDTTYNFNFIIDAFASADTTQKQDADTGKSPFIFDVGTVRLKNIRVRFNDETGGMDLGLALNSLDIRMRELDPTKMIFKLKSLKVDGLNTTFTQDTSLLANVDSSESKPIELAVDDIDLKNIDFRFTNIPSKMMFALQLGALNITPELIDLQARKLTVNKLKLQNTKAVFEMQAQQAVVAEEGAAVADSATNDWTVKVKDIKVDNVWFKMDDRSQRPIPRGMDYAHLDFQHFNLSAENILYSPHDMAATIAALSVQEKSGLNIESFKANVKYNDSSVAAASMFLKTPNTVLQNKIVLRYPSIKAFTEAPERVAVDIDLQKSVVGIADVLLFVPDLLQTQPALARRAKDKISFELIADGKLNALNLPRLKVNALDGTVVDLHGRIDGLPDTNKIAYNLVIAKLASRRSDLEPFLPAQAKTNVRIPDAFSLNGTLRGTMKDYYPQLTLTSTDGSATVRGYLKMSGGQTRESYDLDLRTHALQVGRIIKKDTLLGAITADLKVRGSSFDMNKMKAEVQGAIHSAFVKGYAYKDVTFGATMADLQAKASLVSLDPNARLSMDADADLRNKQAAAIWANLIVDSVDFEAIKMSARPLKMSAIVKADFPVLNAEYPEGDLIVAKPWVSSKKGLITTDTIFVRSRPSADSGQNILVQMDFLQAAISGKIPLAQIPAALQQHINRHYNPLAKPDTTALAQGNTTSAPPQVNNDSALAALGNAYNLNVRARMFPGPLLDAFVPQLTDLDTVQLNASMNAQTLNAAMTANRITYGTTSVSGFKLDLNERDSGLVVDAALERLTQGKLQLLNTALKANASGNVISADITANDEENKKRFALGANLMAEGNAQALSLKPGLMLNYTNWSVAQPNQMVFGPEGFYVQNLTLSGNGASIAVNSEAQNFNAPLNAKITNFRIADIMQMVSGDTLFADGIINADAQLKQMKPYPLVDAKVTVGNLSVMQDTLGELSAVAAVANESTVNADVQLKGNGNDLSVKGNYFMQPQNGNEFNFAILLNAINLRSFEGVAQKQIKNSSGFIRGNINLTGSAQKPVMDGKIQTENLQTTVSALNSTFRMPSEVISLAPGQVRFEKFKILDSASRPATIDGTIAISDFNKMMLDLSVDAKNWKALSSRKTDNNLFYGDLLLSTKLNIDGPMNSPNINGSLNILKGTKMTVVMPDRSAAMQDHAGIVVFVDRDNPPKLAPIVMKDTTFTRFSPGSQLNVNVTTDEEAEFNVIIDQATGDFLSVRGKAQLNTAIDAGGSLSLNGLYELNSGAYQLNYNLIKRKFEIVKGSTIKFSGDPLEADMRITAVYKANVAPYDLVERQVPDPAQLVYFRQQLPFNVELKMNGPLLLPQLSFDIVLPENTTYRLSSDQVQLVQAKLSQLRIDTSELNKQVFALLILKRFITDDPFSSSTGSTAEFAAKQSVSRFIGEQLNQFANRLVNGVDLEVDLASTEDYTTGTRRERTDLNVAASKRLLNDRLKVTIGNNFELEGPQTQGNNPNNSLVPGNLAVDYSLTSNNRYMVRAYRQSLDQGVIQGFVTETGVNFIVSYDYNRFKNLFIRRKVLEARRKARTAPKTADK